MEKNKIEIKQIDDGTEWNVVWKDRSIGLLERKGEKHFVFSRRAIDGMMIHTNCYGMSEPEECFTVKRGSIELKLFHRK
jgi:hypothetical protein